MTIAKIVYITIALIILYNFVAPFGDLIEQTARVLESSLP